MSPFRFDRTVSFGNILTMLIVGVPAIWAIAQFYFGTQTLAKDQKRQDADITRNATSSAVNSRDIQDSKVKFRGLEVQVDTELRNIYKQQKENASKLDRLIDLQLRGPR